MNDYHGHDHGVDAGRHLLDVDDDIPPLIDVRGVGRRRHGAGSGLGIDPEARAARRERARYYDLAFDARQEDRFRRFSGLLLRGRLLFAQVVLLGEVAVVGLLSPLTKS